MWRYLVFAGFFWPYWGMAEVFSGHVTHVSDGDTLWVKPQGEDTARKLRLQGLDAPELCQAGGPASRDALVQMVSVKPVQVSVKYQDIYGRGLAVVQVDGQDVGARMVEAGHAWSSRWHRSSGPYAIQEAAAKAARRGVFASAGAELPRDFRKRVGSCYPTKP
jgi:endonuclease YncB( thermonuclease family)